MLSWPFFVHPIALTFCLLSPAARSAEVVELDPSVDAVDQASEGALDKELASNKMLPENEKEKAQAFGKNYVLTTYATEDCSGKVACFPSLPELRYFFCWSGAHAFPLIRRRPPKRWRPATTARRSRSAQIPCGRPGYLFRH